MGLDGPFDPLTYRIGEPETGGTIVVFDAASELVHCAVQELELPAVASAGDAVNQVQLQRDPLEPIEVAVERLGCQPAHLRARHVEDAPDGFQAAHERVGPFKSEERGPFRLLSEPARLEALPQ